MRVSRNCYNSKFFHVMVQGIRKEKIFKENFLKEIFISYLKEGAQNNSVNILAYCVMDNHAHVLIYTEEIEHLTCMMRSLNTRYAKKYNKIYHRCGYVFRDRYRCESIMTVEHLKNCIRYIHNNPVKADICNKCSDYTYSSYNEYLNNRIDTNIVKKFLGDDLNFIFDLNKTNENAHIFLDVENEFCDNSNVSIGDIVDDYCTYNNVLKEDLSKEQLAELIKLLINKYGVTKKEIQVIFKLSKYMTYQLIRNEKYNTKKCT